MNHQPLTLYTDANFFSPYVMSVFVALTEKTLPFSLKPINLSAGEHIQEAYTRLSMTHRVPTLVVDDFSLSESSAITEYLEDCFPSPEYSQLYPPDRQERARTREIQAWLRSDLVPIRTERPTEVIFAGVKLPPLTEGGQQAVNKLISGLEPLLADGRQNLFSEWCIADSDLALMLNRLVSNGDKLPKYLRQYAQHQWQRPSIQQWCALSQK